MTSLTKLLYFLYGILIIARTIDISDRKNNTNEPTISVRLPDNVTYDYKDKTMLVSLHDLYLHKNIAAKSL